MCSARFAESMKVTDVCQLTAFLVVLYSMVTDVNREVPRWEDYEQNTAQNTY